ncbi:MAG: GTPase ObgE, partial [Anaerolineales bacterium]
DGGDGGDGGAVCLVVDPGLNTLFKFQRQRRFHAQPGAKGGGSNKTGKSADDLEVAVPPGTVVRDSKSGATLGDLTEHSQRLVVAAGGKGGRGNARFATSRNQAPRIADKGAPGEVRVIELELKLIADVGIVGMPNAGKSTLLTAVSAARPKVAPYPFTTLVPNLGVVDLSEYRTLVMADIPGLIEGAHAGAGLGAEFLRHVQRTRVLIHLLDGLSDDPLADFSQIQSEMALFDPDLAAKPLLVVLNKTDLDVVQAKWPSIQDAFADRGHEAHAISAATGAGTRNLLYRAAELLSEAPDAPTYEELPVYRPQQDPDAIEVSVEADGVFRLAGVKIERAAQMTYWEYDDAVRRFQRILEALGAHKLLEEAGVQDGDTVHIGEYELTWEE